MKRKGLGIALTLVCWTLAGSCALDDREVHLVGLPPFGSSDGLPAEIGGPSVNTSEPMLSAPQLVVGPDAIDLGRVTTGFSARARIRIENAGSAPLPVPAVRFAQGSHADFSLIQNECSNVLAPGQTCGLRVQLVPSNSGARAATLEVSSEAGGSASVGLERAGLACW